jgi:hypothetical protein
MFNSKTAYVCFWAHIVRKCLETLTPWFSKCTKLPAEARWNALHQHHFRSIFGFLTLACKQLANPQVCLGKRGRVKYAAFDESPQKRAVPLLHSLSQVAQLASAVLIVLLKINRKKNVSVLTCVDCWLSMKCRQILVHQWKCAIVCSPAFHWLCTCLVCSSVSLFHQSIDHGQLSCHQRSKAFAEISGSRSKNQKLMKGEVRLPATNIHNAAICGYWMFLRLRVEENREEHNECWSSTIWGGCKVYTWHRVFEHAHEPAEIVFFPMRGYAESRIYPRMPVQKLGVVPFTHTGDLITEPPAPACCVCTLPRLRKPLGVQ